jgi:hypothetical protein
MSETILLSTHLGITREDLENIGVYDSTLGVDTKLFVDPKHLVSSDIPEFQDSRNHVLRYFRRLIAIHKISHKTPRLLTKARDMLAVKEPQGLSIGYGDKTDRGTAVPKNVANAILLSLSEIISVGIEDAEVVELLGLFVSGFGPDSISDLTVSITYPHFCSYTQRISKEFGVKTTEFTIEGVKYQLPKHPFRDSQIIFVPSNFLQQLPMALDWDGIAEAAEHNEKLRDDFHEILLPVIGEVFDEAESKSPEELEVFKTSILNLVGIYRAVQKETYNLDSDVAGFYNLKPFADSQNAVIVPTNQPKNQAGLMKATLELLEQFKRGVEDNAGNKLLYHKTPTGVVIKEKPHREDVLQTLFYLIGDLYCSKAKIALHREPNAGRGPVDFSLSLDYDTKILVETKKSTNNDLLKGYSKQVEAYKKGEHAFACFYVVVIVKETNPDKENQLDILKKQHKQNKKDGKNCPELFIVDGLIYPSPSNLK